jgi:hypothetical protein
MVKQRVAFWDTPLEIARWEAVRGEFNRHANDPLLQSDVAFFFNNVRLNAERISSLFEFVRGPSAAMSNAAEVRDIMGEDLLRSLRDLQEEAKTLDERLRRLVIPEDSVTNVERDHAAGVGRPER